MSFVSGLSLPNSVNKEVQAIELVDDFIQSVYKNHSAKKLDELFLDYHLNTNKKLRAKLCLDVAKNLGLRSKDVLGWACGCEIFNNSLRISELSLNKILSQGSVKNSEEIKSIYECQIASSSLLALMPLSLGQIPINDGIKNRLLITIMDYSLKVNESHLALLNLDFQNPSDYLDIVSRKAQALYEMPVYGTALIVGLSEKEAKRISENFRELGVLALMVEDIVAIYGEKKDIESPLSFVNILLSTYISTFPNLKDSVLQKALKAIIGETSTEDLAKEFVEKNILQSVLSILRAQITTIEKSESLKPWPKLVELARIYSHNLTRPVDHLLKEY